MAAFATVDQYTARFGAVADEGVLQQCLDDASAVILATLEQHGIDYMDMGDEYADRLMRVCRSMANRIMPTDAEMPAGATQASMTGGPYSQSWTFSAPYGTPKMLASEMHLLGLSTSYIGSIRPRVGGA